MRSLEQRPEAEGVDCDANNGESDGKREAGRIAAGEDLVMFLDAGEAEKFDEQVERHGKVAPENDRDEPEDTEGEGGFFPSDPDEKGDVGEVGVEERGDDPAVADHGSGDEFAEALTLTFTHAGEAERTITLASRGATWGPRVTRLFAALGQGAVATPQAGGES